MLSTVAIYNCYNHVSMEDPGFWNRWDVDRFIIFALSRKGKQSPLYSAIVFLNFQISIK